MPKLLFLIILLYAPFLHGNELQQSPSPYLAMHGKDPVNWHGLTHEALTKAQKTQKIIFISSGYFACHWCHVMQRESYQNPEIAEFLNDHFIAIKMDRELNPVIDAQLIQFVERTRGQAGWPLNVFLTPEGYPLFGMTYLPPAEFMSVMTQLATLWTEDPDELRVIAQSAAEETRLDEDRDNQRLKTVDKKALKDAFIGMVRQYGNDLEGGFGNGAKFPHAPQLTALLSLEEQTDFLRTTLNMMASEHLYDHLNGGFFRYTTDPDWQTPHFEKMLYDNAQLASLYLLAGQLLEEPRYTEIAIETLHFVIRSMRHEDGGYIASLSAVDAQGIEGGFYLWEKESLSKILDKESYALIHQHWDMDHASRFEDGYLPTKRDAVTGPQRKKLDGIYDQLRLLREKEGSLPVDDKRLTGWNGLALTALARCAKQGDALCKDQASKQTTFIKSLISDQGLVHGLDRNGKDLGPATLEDYAYVIQGLSEWGKISKDASIHETAQILKQKTSTLFHRPDGWMASHSSLLPGTRPQHHMPDTVLPSPTSTLLAEDGQISTIENIKGGITLAVRENPFSHAGLIVLVSGLDEE